MYKFMSETHITTIESHKQKFLMDYGDDYKFSGPNQHVIWEADDADIILKELNL